MQFVEDNPLKIAILSRDPRLYSTKRIKAAAEQRGHQVRIIDALHCVAITRARDKLRPNRDPLEFIERNARMDKNKTKGRG